MIRATHTAKEVGELLGLSEWAVLQAARRGDTPLGEIALRIGRRIVFPKTKVDDLLGVDRSSDSAGISAGAGAALPLAAHLHPEVDLGSPEAR